VATIRSTATTTSALAASSTLCQPTNSTGVVQLAQPADSSPRPSNTCDQGGGSTCFASEGTLWHLSGWIRSQSTCSPHSPRQMSLILYRRGRGTALVPPIQCPDAVVLYSRYMAGVDKGDQYRQYYHIRTKCLKSYKYIFWFLFDVAINAYILSTFAPTTMSTSQTRLKQFRLKLAEQLVGNYNSRKALGRPSVHVPPPRAPVSCPPPPPRAVLHLPSRLQKRKRCAYCTQRRDPPSRKDTSFYCSECTDHPPLCFTGTGDGSDCFRLLHQH
jgi:hypothetical protein